MTGIGAQNMLDGIAVSRQHFEAKAVRDVPASYQDIDVSWRVAKLIQSYTEYVNRKTWHKSHSE
jgi:UDP-N-acetylglucosamine 2-epimerase